MKELKEDNDILREKIQDLEVSAVSSTQYYPAYRSLLIFFISVSYENLVGKYFLNVPEFK